MTRWTYQHLVALVGGDAELVERLVDEGVIETRDSDVVLVDVDRVLLCRTLWRELEIDWAGIEVILRLHDDLSRARERIAELERRLGDRSR
jgi:hypothetical protein